MLEAIKMYFLPCSINVITVIYLIKTILDANFRFPKIITFLLILTLNFFVIFSYIFIPDYFRIVAGTIIITVFSLLIFNCSRNRAIIATLLEQLIFLISEVVFALFIIFISNIIKVNLYDYKGRIITNILICFFSVLIIKNNKSKKIMSYILKIINNLHEFNRYLLLYTLFFTTNILLAIIYLNYGNLFMLIINLFFMIFYNIIVFQLFFEIYSKNNYIVKNKILLSNLNEYEKMLDYQRINNHENKNQLLVIKSMVEKEDKKTIEYINEIIKEKREDNELMYTKAKRIPTGGLQGLVYQKMLVMQENYVNVVLDVSSNVRKIDFSILSSKMNYDICRIMGIILDNAIEEAIKFNRKEREIVISMYIDELFIIEVSNRIKDNVDLDKIYDKGYTSKEKGHGYGLSLLKKIVDENDSVINELKITNDIFTQVIKIKM